MVEAIAATPVEEVARHLDYGLAGRPVHLDFAKAFGDVPRYQQWRRPIPPVLNDLLAAGDAVLAQEAATAFGRFFAVAIADDWPQVTAVLDADIAHRSEVIAERGLAAMLGTLGSDLAWDGQELTLARHFEMVVDWPDDGLLLSPCTALPGPILFTAKRPRTPLLTYPARGTLALKSRPRESGRTGHLRDLIGATRLGILHHLSDPHTTQELGQLDGHAPATISYHLGVLRRGGLVTSRRSGCGRGVLYWRTALGDALLTRELAPDTGAR